MSDEFDFESEFEFDDQSDEDLIDFDEFDGELDAVEVRTAVLQKSNMVALLCIKTAAAGAAICRVDPREDRPSVQIYNDADAAVEWFTRSLHTSRKNGWNVVYDGLPLHG
jgi:hypothetical protein